MAYVAMLTFVGFPSLHSPAQTRPSFQVYLPCTKQLHKQSARGSGGDETIQPQGWRRKNWNKNVSMGFISREMSVLVHEIWMISHELLAMSYVVMRNQPVMGYISRDISVMTYQPWVVVHNLSSHELSAIRYSYWPWLSVMSYQPGVYHQSRAIRGERRARKQNAPRICIHRTYYSPSRPLPATLSRTFRWAQQVARTYEYILVQGFLFYR